MDEARKQFLAGYLQGQDVLLMAQSNDTARELSGRIRDDLQHLGLVERGAEASLREGAKASVGDLIVTRKIDHQLGVANGDTWRVEAVNGETITMRKMLDADRATGVRRYADTTVEYEAAREAADLAYADNPDREDEPETASRPADLGYAITGHTAQGRTVWQGIALITGTEGRNWAYVALTRGREGNYAWVVGQPAKVADPAPGVRPAPELGRRERIERERAGLPDEERELTPLEKELAREPIAVLADVLERDGAEYRRWKPGRRTWPTPITWPSCTPSGPVKHGNLNMRGMSASCTTHCPAGSKRRSPPAPQPGFTARCGTPRRQGSTAGRY